MPVPITVSSAAVDLSQRFDRTTTVAASPAGASETIIAQFTANTDEAITEGVDLEGWAAFTVGTSGTATELKIRRTNVSGTVVATSGAVTRTAGQLVEQTVQGFDTNVPATGQVYCLTLTVTAGAAASTVSAVKLTGTQV